MSSADGQVVRRLISEGFSDIGMIRMCMTCNGAGTVTDRSSAAAQTHMGMPIESMPHAIKCADCIGGWQHKKLNVGDFLDWLIEELHRHVEHNPKTLLNALVQATELVMTENADLTQKTDAARPR